MVAIVVKVCIDPANADTFEKAFDDLAMSVRANEPDTIAYHLARDRREAGVYRIVEVYRNEEALKAHLATPYFQAFRPGLMALLLTPPETERLDLIV